VDAPPHRRTAAMGGLRQAAPRRTLFSFYVERGTFRSQVTATYDSRISDVDDDDARMVGNLQLGAAIRCFTGSEAGIARASMGKLRRHGVQLRRGVRIYCTWFL